MHINKGFKRLGLGVNLKIFAVVGLLFNSLFVLPAFSASSDLPEFTGPEMLVTSHRLPGTITLTRNYPGNATVMNADEIAASGASNLPELLSRFEGLTVSDALGFGLEGRIDMRGFGGEGNNVLITVDGIKMSEPFDNSMAWRMISMKDIARLEIIRGGSSSVYGGGAISGVINIVTKKADSRLTKINIPLGSYGQQGYALEHTNRMGKLSYRLSGSYDKLDGYRANSQLEGTTGLARIDYELEKNLTVTLTQNHHNDRTGIAGGILAGAYNTNPTQANEFSAPGDKFTNILNLTTFGVERNFPQAGGRSHTFHVTSFVRNRTQDSLASFSGGSATSLLNTGTFGSIVQADISNQIGFLPGQLSIGAEYQTDNIQSPLDGTSFGFAFSTRKSMKRDTVGLFVEERLPLRDNVFLLTGARLDHENFDLQDALDPTQNRLRNVSAVSPKIGLTFVPRAGLTTYLSYGWAFKAPEANTMLFEAPGLFSANPNIEPERANAIEAGVKFGNPDGPQLKTAAYHTFVFNEIIFNPFSGFGTNENFNTKRRGIETAFILPVSPHVTVSTTYTYTNAIIAGGNFAGNRIPLVPAHTYTARVDYTPWAGLTVSFDGLRVTDQFALNDLQNSTKIEGYTVVNAGINMDIGGTQTYLRATNLFNEKYSPFTATNAAGTVRFNPAPGFGLTGGVQLIL